MKECETYKNENRDLKEEVNNNKETIKQIKSS
jgi:hypothetical protein